MKITIVGGGNIGTQFAVHCAEKGNEVRIFTSEPHLFSKHLSIVDDSGNVTHEGNIELATNDPVTAFGLADLIIVTMPSTMMHLIADVIYDHSNCNTIIGVVPGNGGSECAFKKCIERGNIFFGIERVPAIARLVEKGHVVKSTGYRDELHIAAIPKSNADRCSEIIQNIFDIKCSSIPCLLSLTMTPSNPILHTTRLRTLFSTWHNGVEYEYVPLFYEEWDDSSSALLLACDDEVQSICRCMPQFHLEYVESLRIHYESDTIEAMTKKISSIPAFQGLETPTVRGVNGLIPDLHSRYFTADFSYGLSVIKQIADFAGVIVPYISETMEWYKEIAIVKKHFNYGEFGIFSFKEFERFYLL